MTGLPAYRLDAAAATLGLECLSECIAEGEEAALLRSLLFAAAIPAVLALAVVALAAPVEATLTEPVESMRGLTYATHFTFEQQIREGEGQRQHDCILPIKKLALLSNTEQSASPPSINFPSMICVPKT